jgi:two-component SAPR family response regulator
MQWVQRNGERRFRISRRRPPSRAPARSHEPNEAGASRGPASGVERPTPGAAPTSEAFATARVRIRTLGGFSVAAGAQNLVCGPSKPMQVVKALVALGPRPVRLDTLATLLWPEHDREAARDACQMTIHWLRTLLGDDDLVQVSEGRVQFAPGSVAIDVEALRAMCLFVARGIRSGSIAGRRVAEQHTRQLLGLYAGHFLPSDSEPWVLAARERARRRFLRAATALAPLLDRIAPTPPISAPTAAESDALGVTGSLAEG